MNGYMCRVRLIIGDGTCEHYQRIGYVKKFCGKCSMWYLACPLCKPTYCPSCREEMREKRKKIKKNEVAYYKAKGYRKNNAVRIQANLKAWREKNKDKIRSYDRIQYWDEKFKEMIND